MSDEHPSIPRRPGSAGILHLYTGDGKGKTTAAIGLAVRAAGWGKRVLIVQFLKDAADPSGEVHLLSRLPGVTIVRGSVPVPSFAARTDAEREAVARSVREVAGRLVPLFAGRHDLVILDELAVALSLGCLTEEQGRSLVAAARGAAADVVVTGRNAPEWLVASADLVTEMRCVRHPYDGGLGGRKGIEW